MAVVINGSGTVTGLAVGGLPDGTVDAGTLATNSVDSAELVDGSIDSSHLASGVGGVSGITSSADATAITIDSSERVGIGAAPAYLLDVHSTATSGTTVTANLSNDKYGVSTGYTALQIGTQNDDGSSRIVSRNNSGNQSELTLQPHAATSGVWTDALTLTSDGDVRSETNASFWVNFNGQGTVSIRDSHNVSSIGDWDTGNYGLYISGSLTNANYAVTGTTDLNRFVCLCLDHTNPTSGRWDLYTMNTSGSAQDRSYVYLIGIGGR